MKSLLMFLLIACCLGCVAKKHKAEKVERPAKPVKIVKSVKKTLPKLEEKPSSRYLPVVYKPEPASRPSYLKNMTAKDKTQSVMLIGLDAQHRCEWIMNFVTKHVTLTDSQWSAAEQIIDSFDGDFQRLQRGRTQAFVNHESEEDLYSQLEENASEIAQLVKKIRRSILANVLTKKQKTVHKQLVVENRKSR